MSKVDYRNKVLLIVLLLTVRVKIAQPITKSEFQPRRLPHLIKSDMVTMMSVL